MASEFRITRSQKPCEKLTTYVNIINKLALSYLDKLSNEKDAENADNSNKEELYTILEQMETTIKDILLSLDTKKDDNYVDYKGGKKMIVHKAVKGWIEQSEKNRDLVNKIMKLHNLSPYELSEVIMTHICRYCVSKLRELLSSSTIVDISNLKVKDLSNIHDDVEIMEHLKVALAVLMNIRDILSGTSKNIRLLHQYIKLELEKNVLYTIKVDKNLDLTVEEVTELQIHKHGDIQSQQIELEEKDTRYKISHFIPYNNNPSIKERHYSQLVIPPNELLELNAKGISETSLDRINLFTKHAEEKLDNFLKVLIPDETKDKEKLKMRQKTLNELEDEDVKKLSVYRKIGDIFKNVYNHFLSSWKQANESILKTARALKAPLDDLMTIIRENKIDKYPILDIESTMPIEQIQKDKQELLEDLFNKYLYGSISKDDILRNVLVYVVIRYAHTMYCDLITLMLKNKQTLAFSRAIRNIYIYDDLDVLEHEYPEGKEGIKRIAELIASILIAYVLQFFLKHYDKNDFNKNKNAFSIESYLKFMLVNLETFQQTLFDIAIVTISRSINSSTSDTILVHNYMRMDNMMYLANIIANSWPLFSPFFASSTANVWTVYREIENESFVKHDESLGIIEDDIIDRIEKDENDNPFIVFSHIPILWPWNRKSKGERQLKMEEIKLLPQIQAMYKEKIRETEERPSKSALKPKDNKSNEETKPISIEELSEIIQRIMDGYNTLIDLRLVKINIFYQMNLVYEAFNKLRDNISNHLEEGTTVKKLEELSEEDRVIEEDLRHPLFTKNITTGIEYALGEPRFDINYVDFAKNIFRYINTIVTRLFFICGLGMQSESGYYIVEEGIVRRVLNKRNFTNWSKSLLIDDSDLIKVAYSVIKGLSFVSSKHHDQIHKRKKIVKWVEKMLKSETQKLMPIIQDLIQLSSQIQKEL
jgi:hypothetical protein